MPGSITENGGSVNQGVAVPLVIDGKDINPQDTFDVVSPGTGKSLHKCANANVSHAQSAIDAGAKAFESWSQTTPTHRRGIFLKAAEILDRRSAELKEYISTETGCDENWAAFNLFLGKECLLDCASRITGLEGRIPSSNDPSVGALIVKEPFGVVLAMAPW